MFIGKVVGNIVSTLKHEAYQNKKIMIVQPLDIEGNPKGSPMVAVDYVGAGEGDIVLAGSGPGVAREVFGLERAPIRTLIMGIIDYWEVDGEYVFRK